MQLKTRHNDVRSNGSIGNKKNFSIAVNAKTFKIWSDSIYEDKIGSIVRELSCNAIDAHREAGTPQKPFTIHLPNVIEPWFSVKDQGVGISDQDMEDVFIIYGESTKETNNDDIGAFGLGCKTPFAYTDQFTITSIHNGMKRMYVAVIGNDGLPELNLQAENETDEHPGLEITMAVNNDDFYKFENAIINQLMFFPVKPILEYNMNNIQFPDINQNIFLQNEKITMYKKNQNNPFSGIRIVQGGVGYPLNPNNLGDLNHQTEEFIDELMSNGAYMEFPIGSISVSASREGISYEDETIQNIIDRIEDVANEICIEAKEKVKNAPTLWERVIIFNNEIKLVKIAIQNSPEFDTWFEGDIVSKKFGNMKINTKKFHDLDYKISYMNVEMNRNGNYSLSKKTVGEYDRLRPSYKHPEIGLYPTKDMKIFIRDTTKKPIARVREYCNNHHGHVMFVEHRFNKLIEDDAIKTIADSLGLPESHIYKISDVPAPKNVSKSTGQSEVQAKGFKFNSFNIGGNKYTKDWQKIMNLDDLNNGVYVEMDRRHIQFNDYSESDYLTVLTAYKHNIIDMPIIAVNKKNYQKIKDGKIGTNFVSVNDVATGLNQKIQELEPIFNSIKKYQSFFNHITNSTFEKIIELYNNDSSMISKINSIKTRIEQLESRLGNYKIFYNNPYHCEHYKLGIEKAKEKMEEIYQHYPMLKIINHHRLYDDDDMQKVIDYMKMVDGA